MYQLDAPLSPLTYHFAVLPERCTYWECQADLCKAHTIFPPSANNTQYAHFSDNTSTTQGLTQPPHHVQSKNFFRANCSYYRVKVPEQPPNANLSHPTKVQTDHLHHTPKHPHSTHHSMYHTHHPSSPEHLPGIPIDNQPQPPYPPQFPALLRQYQHVFSRNKFAVPCLKVPPVRIATNSDKVVTIRPYRVPICDQREIRSQIRQMLDNDIIEPSYSPFSSPVTLVTKRDKTKRFCIDYRKVNEVISSDVHPLPRIEDILDRLARAKYFSTADVSSAYWQVPIHPDSRPLLAFATIDGLYQPTRLPFGLKTSPQIYERAINQVLQGHGLDCVAHYFDDFVIYSETLEEHQEHLRKFFAFCDAENLQLNLTKCEFFRQTIEFLGYTITAGTTTPLIRNTDVIHAIPPPNNRKTLQSFLGAVNVYNKFIPDYARLRTPLNNLLKKDVTWDWDDKCQKAFTSLKESLTQHPVLHLYKDELPCQVYCDASTLGIAGVLKQVHSAGKAYPVQYFSRALRVHERNYTISELECLAIVESVEKFRVYLMGRKFTIFSDHHALQWLKTIKNPSGRLFRWSLRLSCYEYEVRYIKGALQHEADLLSRNPFCGFLDATLIKNHQLTPSGESKLTIDRNGLQTLKRRGVTKIVVPDALVPDLLTKVHSRYNHPGISQMTRLISPQYYWKGMSEDISKTTKACAICQSTKPPRGPTFGELGQLPVATQPFDLVALDTIAGLAKYGNAKAYLHVVVDHFSRYTWTFPSKSTSITTYQQVIKRVLQDGSPKRLLTDRAPAFTSPKFRKFLINRNIHPLLTTSNNPQANGLCERLNATLTGKLRLLHLENPKAAWTKLAKRVTVVYNNTPHSVTGFPPGYLMFGVLPPELTEHVNPYPVLTTARRIAHERTQAKHLKDKHAYDQQHKTPHFEPGDLVLVKVYHHPNTGKLAPYFTGPYEILEIISPNVSLVPLLTYLIQYELKILKKLSGKGDSSNVIKEHSATFQKLSSILEKFVHQLHLTQNTLTGIIICCSVLLEATVQCIPQDKRGVPIHLGTGPMVPPAIRQNVLDEIMDHVLSLARDPASSNCYKYLVRLLDVLLWFPEILPFKDKHYQIAAVVLSIPTLAITKQTGTLKDLPLHWEQSKHWKSMVQPAQKMHGLTLIPPAVTFQWTLDLFIRNLLVEVYGEKCMDIKNVRKWCREFNEGRINVHDEQRSGRPSLPESTVARIDEMVRANRRITLEEIEDGLNEDCSHFSMHKIVSETLGYRKVSARWVDKWLKEAVGEWYNTGITKLVDRMKKLIEHQGDYVEK
ncbi:hypothetical protein LAZ67_12002480 [Cordylochernes scorpioides]|uniref:RNA-directed DNA polymerase n=1 Tax=Cordylochernes scorpioides TaxID=51811 RepID=A0ABY6L496_9ARAC|nr:hypothetical protein LAZ67_12002480 [Cordylochernes scorpioides]